MDALSVPETSDVPKRRLGRTNEMVSVIGLGGFHIGQPSQADGDAVALIHAAIDRGITFLDNSWDYNAGLSELRMGRALSYGGYRDKVFLMTKIDGRTKAAAKEQIEQSLSRLLTDRLDLLQFHENIRPDDADRIFAPGGAFEAALEAQRAGKIRFIGFTGHKRPDYHLHMIEVARRNDFVFDTVQMPLNVMDAHYESFEKKVIPVAQELDMGILAMKTFGDHHILDTKLVDPIEMLHYSMNLPVSVVITGIDKPEILDQALRAAATFRPLEQSALQALLARTADRARDGKTELYKSSHFFDSTFRIRVGSAEDFDMTVRAQFPEEQTATGEFARQEDAFTDWVSAGGETGYRAEAGRYHLYVSLACPWAHRTILMRRLLGLESAIGMTVVDPFRDEHGWRFADGDGFSADPINGFTYLSEAYGRMDPAYRGRVTVPVLWDTQTSRIVSNNDDDIMRMLETEFGAFSNGTYDFYPVALRADIDTLNGEIFRDVNNGVYRAGFATTQRAYEHAAFAVFRALDRLEERLGTRRYLFGAAPVETDFRLFVTLVRFDPVYVGHFKCNLRRIADYPNLYGYLRDLYQIPGVAETVDFAHIKRHYYATHDDINPTRIVPIGPEIELAAAHGREALG